MQQYLTFNQRLGAAATLKHGARVTKLTALHEPNSWCALTQEII